MAKLLGTPSLRAWQHPKTMSVDWHYGRGCARQSNVSEGNRQNHEPLKMTVSLASEAA
jgi:hypothetical protein